jgi:transposase
LARALSAVIAILEQMELELADLEADASEGDLVAESAAAKTSSVVAFERKRLARKPFPEHLPRERIVIPAPCSCPDCGGTRLSKLGEDVTETLEMIPGAWKVVQTVREKFACISLYFIDNLHHDHGTSD